MESVTPAPGEAPLWAAPHGGGAGQVRWLRASLCIVPFSMEHAFRAALYQMATVPLDAIAWLLSLKRSTEPYRVWAVLLYVA